MATALTNQGPLDDYLREFDDHQSTSNDGNDATELWGDFTALSAVDGQPVASTSSHQRQTSIARPVPGAWLEDSSRGCSSAEKKQKRASGLWESVMSNANHHEISSSSLPPISLLTPPPQFPEKFKYLVCSSALLDPSLVGVGNSVATVAREGSENKLRRAAEGFWLARFREGAANVVRAAHGRPDIALAGAILFIGLAICFGPILVAVLFVVSLVTAISLGVKKTRLMADPMSVNVDTMSPTMRNPQVMTLESLEGLIAESEILDREVADALEILRREEEHPASRVPSHGSSTFGSNPSLSSSTATPTEPLRIHLHRLAMTLTDHFATAYSNLLPLCSPTDLAVFSHMYGVPDAPEGRRRRRGTPSEGEESATVPPPLQRSLSSENGDADPGKTILHRKSPLSLGPRRYNHQPHRSLALPVTTTEDRFTTIPPRTPRLSKRSSWNDGLNKSWSAPTGTESPRRARPVRRISEDEGEEASTTTSSSDQPRTPLRPLFSPQRVKLAQALRFPHTPQSSARMQPLRLDSPKPLAATSGLLPALALSDSMESRKSVNKRSSLQSLPYYPPESNCDHRTTVPSDDSHLQRSRSLGGQPLSARWKARSTDHRLSPLCPPSVNKPSSHVRSNSHSPLTLPALKAAFLGAQLKRKRAACCLLALRFNRSEERDRDHLRELAGARYWLQVRAVLESLRADCREERQEVEMVKERVIADAAAPVSTLQARGQRDWQTTAWDSRALDFAPRAPDEEIMLAHLQALDTMLRAASAGLRDVSQDLVGNDVPSASEKWTALRADIAEFVREWERGKGVLDRLGGKVAQDNLPPFMKAWSESPPLQPSTPLALSPTAGVSNSPPLSDNDNDSEYFDDVGSHLVDSASPASLPPAGIDAIFESLSDPPRERSKLSREERIKISRAAAGSFNGTVRTLDFVNAHAKAAGGQVVEELQGVIGLIQKKKGNDDCRKEATMEPPHSITMPRQSFAQLGLALPLPPQRSDKDAGLIVGVDDSE